MRGSNPTTCTTSSRTAKAVSKLIDAASLHSDGAGTSCQRHLVVYADNCSGQNKNNLAIKFFLALVHMGTLDRVDFEFLCQGTYEEFP
jgi:hypothetical protein